MKAFYTLILAYLFSSVAYSQAEFEFNTNYLWGGGIDYVEGRVDSGDDFSYNFVLQTQFRNNRYIGISYTYLGTDVEFTSHTNFSGNYKQLDTGMKVSFIELRGSQILSVGDKVLPFFNFGIGAAIYDVDADKIETQTRFLMSFGTGVKIPFSEKAGFKINGEVKMPLANSGTGVYCDLGSYGSGCGLSLNSSVLLVHWGLGAGFYYDF